MPEWKSEILKRLAALKLAPAREAEISEELAHHLEDRYRELLSGGASEAEARRLALADLSEEEILAMELRRVEHPVVQDEDILGRSGRRNILADLGRDLRYALRTPLRNPGFTAIAVLTLALGIGANAAIFSVINAVLLRPLPFKDSNRILYLFSRSSLNTGNFEEWRRECKSYQQFAAISLDTADLTGVEQPERLRAMTVSGDFFPMLGFQPALGRPFQPEDFQPENPRTVIVSDRIWRRLMNSDSNALGKWLLLDRTPHAVVGVMPAQLGPIPYPDIDVWLPLLPSRARVTSAVGRLKPGATLESARAEAEALAARFKNPRLQREGEPLIHVEPLKDQLVEDSRLTLLLLAGAVGCVLLIACANVANLLMVRMAGREREIAVRKALGASRARVVRQLLTEGILLSAAGAMVGLLAAHWVTRLLILQIPYQVPRIGQSRIDGMVLAFTLLVAVTACLLFNLTPALATFRLDINSALKEGARGEMSGGRSRQMRGALVVFEVALAMFLLVGAGLLIKAFFVLRPSNPGFDAENKLTLRVDLPSRRYPKAAQRTSMMRQIMERLQALPGVTGVASVSNLPMTGMSFIPDISVGGQLVAGAERGVYVHYRDCTPNYFTVMAMPIVAGRNFSDADHEGAPNAAVINQTMAARFWPGKDPVGQLLTVTQADQPRESTVVGVVRDSRIFWETTDSRPELYVPFWQDPAMTMSLVVHTSDDPTQKIGPMREVLHGLDKEFMVSDVQIMDQLLFDSIASPRFNARLFGILAGLALVLALVGMYGVISYTISRRTHEFGVRMALGAHRRNILQLVMKQGMSLAMIGTALGLGGSVVLTRLLESLLFQVSPLDPFTYAAVTLLLLSVALLACYIPARRATKVDPMVALRYE